MGVGEEHEHLLASAVDARNHAIGAGGHVPERLALGDRRRPDRPVGLGDAQIGGAQSVELAVVPLRQVVAALGTLPEARQRAGVARPLQRAGEHDGALDAVDPGELRGKRCGAAAADGGQRDVGATGVSPVDAPLGLTVADEVHPLDGVVAHRRDPTARRRTKLVSMILEFSGEVFQWRGPAPFYYVAAPEPESADIEDVSHMVSYGWGCIPVTVRIGTTVWETSLFPKDGLYLVPLKAAVRRAEGIDDGDTVRVQLTVGGPD